MATGPVTLVVLVCSLVSFVLSAFVLCRIALGKWHESLSNLGIGLHSHVMARRSPTTAVFTVAITLCCLLSSGLLLLPSSLVSASSTVCDVAGGLLQASFLAQAVWLTSTAHWLWFRSKHHRALFGAADDGPLSSDTDLGVLRRYRLRFRFYYTVSLLVATGTGLAAAVSGAITTNTEGGWCWIDMQAHTLRDVLFFGPVGALFVVAVVFVVLTRKHTRDGAPGIPMELVYLLSIAAVTASFWAFDKGYEVVSGRRNTALMLMQLALVASEGGIIASAVTANLPDEESAEMSDIFLPILTRGTASSGALTRGEDILRKLRGVSFIADGPVTDEPQVMEEIASLISQQNTISARLRELRATLTTRHHMVLASVDVLKAVLLALLLASWRGALALMETASKPSISPLTLNCIRSLAGSLFFVGYILAMRAAVKRGIGDDNFRRYCQQQAVYMPDVKRFAFTRKMFCMTLLNNQIPINLMPVASLFVTPTIIPVLLALVPLFTVLMKQLVYRERTVRSTIVAYCVCTVGCVFIVLPQLDGSSTDPYSWIGVLLGLLIPTCWAWANVYNKYHMEEYKSFQVTKAFTQNWMGGVVMFAVMAIAHATGVEEIELHEGWAWWVIAMGFGMFVSVLIMFTLLDWVGPVLFSSVWLIVPIVGIGIELISAYATQYSVSDPTLQAAGAVIVVAGLGYISAGEQHAA